MSRMVKRFLITDRATGTVWWGTCEKWVREFPFPVDVKTDMVRVVNARSEGCPCCGGAHVVVPSPIEGRKW